MFFLASTQNTEQPTANLSSFGTHSATVVVPVCEFEWIWRAISSTSVEQGNSNVHARPLSSTDYVSRTHSSKVSEISSEAMSRHIPERFRHET